MKKLNDYMCPACGYEKARFARDGEDVLCDCGQKMNIKPGGKPIGFNKFGQSR
jgi:hypothetical protein